MDILNEKQRKYQGSMDLSPRTQNFTTAELVLVSKNKAQIIILTLVISLVFNLVYAFEQWNRPDYKIGVLTKDVYIRIGSTETENGSCLLLPRGLVVENESPEGIPSIGQFDPERFSITVTSDSPTLVNYSSKYTKKRRNALYPVKIPKNLSVLSGDECSTLNSPAQSN